MDAANDMNSVISVEEAELYDRQIRLWGLDAQKQLRVSRLLVIGRLNYLATEVCKNVVLAGIGSVTLCDTGKVSADDVAANFVYSSKDVGENRCDTMQHVLHMLNPTVDIHVDMKEAADVDGDYISSSGYNLVLMISSDEKLLTKLSKICHSLQVKFFAANCYGGFGYCFIDLGTHYYCDKKSSEESSNGDGGSAESKPKNVEAKCLVEYKDMACFFTKTWSDPSMIKLKREPGLRTYFLIRAILYYLRSHSEISEESVDDVGRCVELVKDECIREEGHKLADMSLEDDLRYAVGDLCVCGAILGASLAQEIIQAISQSGKPHDNCILLDVSKVALHVVKI